MNSTSPNNDIRVKVIGANGQISLGKEFAGRQVMVEQLDTGVWLIRTARIIPDNEAIFHTSEAKAAIDAATARALKTKPRETDLDAFEAAILSGKADKSNSQRAARKTRSK